MDNGNLPNVEWSRDGQRLYGAGRYDDGSGRNPVRIWENGGKGSDRDVPIADNTVLDLKALSDGGLTFGTYDPAFGVLSASGAERWARRPEIADFRDNYEGFQASFDGGTIRFAYHQWGEAPAVFSLAERRILEGVEDTLLHPPRTKAPGLDIQGWKDTINPTLNGAPLPLEKYERSRSVAIAPDGKHFLLGTEWSLGYFNREGQQQWEVPVPGVAWAVNIAGSGRVGIAAFGDGTIRWYSLADGKELLAFFPHRDAKRWVLWNPAGFFNASPGGEALIGGPDFRRSGQTGFDQFGCQTWSFECPYLRTGQENTR